MSAREKGRAENTRSSSSDKRSLKSGGSKASINVTLPTTVVDDLQRQSPVQVRSLSPGRTTPLQTQPPRTPLATPSKQRRSPVSAQNYPNGSAGRNPNVISPPHSAGAMPPQGTPSRSPHYSDKELEQIYAVHTIERAWISYQDRQMFKLLKHAVCAAETSLSKEILRKVSPKEAELLKDKCIQTKVRFRFGGFEFPPNIYFKIYTGTGQGAGQGTGVRYVSGKKMIRPASEAARDACDLMGHRRFYDQMIQDTMQQESRKITDEIDVTTLKDYMQYMSLLDETPSYMGGKDNSWRKLTLEVLPRQTVFYDIVDYLYNHKMSTVLQEELPSLLSRPNSEDVQLQHIRIISQLRALSPVVPHPTPKSKFTPATPSHVSSRRSKQARHRASKMRQMYEQGAKEVEVLKEASPEPLPETVPPPPTGSKKHRVTYSTEPPASALPVGKQVDTNPGLEDDWEEEEADKLYEWTQELSYDEIVATPRLHTSTSQTPYGVTY